MITPADHGLIYTETNLSHFFPEPFNMISSALFLIPAIYWLVRLNGFSKEYTFLSVATWLLLTGCIGGTFYHGLRRWPVFIMMDWLPIALLCLMASVYFWVKVLGRWLYGILALVVFIAIEITSRKAIGGNNIQLMISINYGIMVLMVLLPLILLLVRLKGNNVWLVVLALLSFGIALFFRIYDKYTHWSIGTHFLWHTFGCIATSFIFLFIYRLRESVNKA